MLGNNERVVLMFSCINTLIFQIILIDMEKKSIRIKAHSIIRTKVRYVYLQWIPSKALLQVQDQGL